ncbi:MAG: hypothetical protein ACREUT_19735 [Steroidobacteraceae bacterium]
MTIRYTVNKSWIGFALSAGLIALPLAAWADASTEIQTAAQHAQFASQATSLKMAHAHLHHTLNCLEGPKGHGFDKKAANPCASQGDGAIPDEADATTKKSLEHIAANARMALRSHSLDKVKEDAGKIQSELGALK